MIMNILIGILEQGFIYGIMALGIYISYSILHFPDLSVDGTFPLGAAVCAVAIIGGVDPWLALLLAFAAGALAGLCTGLIHVRLDVPDLLSGILMMTALYSVNLRIAGAAYLPMSMQGNIFNSGIATLLPDSIATLTILIVVFIAVMLMKYLLDYYLSSKSGFLLRAAGDNERMVTSSAKNPGTMKILGLALCNGFVALSGAVMCQYQRFFEVTMGTGIMVMGLASVIIGTNVFRKAGFLRITSMVVAGSVLYKGAVSIALNMGMQPGDMRLVIAVIFLIALVINNKVINKRKKYADSIPDKKDL